MSRFDRLLENIGLQRTSQLPAISQDRIRSGVPSTGSWVKIGGGINWRRDYAQQDQYSDLNEIFRAWRFNPFVKRIASNWVDFVVGSGIQFKAKDDKVQRLVVDPWLVKNRIESRMKKRALEAHLFAELFSFKRVNVGTGNVRIGFVDPLNVSRIEYDPLDGDTPVAVYTYGQDGQAQKWRIVFEDDAGNAAKIMPDIYGDSRPLGFTKPVTTSGMLVGHVSYLAYNLIIGATRGTSDNLTIIDWARGLEDLLWAAQTRAKEQAKVAWILRFEGATPSTLLKYRTPTLADGKTPNKDYIPPPETNGEVAYLNDKMKLECVTPTMAASDVDQSAKTFRTVVAIGSGQSTSMFGEGDGEGYMNAKEKATPFYQMLKSGQKDFLDFWKDEARFAVDQKRIFTNELAGVTDFGIDVIAPDLSSRSEEGRMNLGKTMSDTFAAWRQSGAISDAQYKDLIKQTSAVMGVELIEDKTQVPVTQIPQQAEIREGFERLMEAR